MMNTGDDSGITIKHTTGRLILPALILSRIATRPQAILMGFLLVNIGLTFGSVVGVMGQILTFSSILSLVFALVMGFLSVRFKPKPLLMVGLFLFVASALGCSFAPNYVAMLLFYSLAGIGVAMVNPMTQTLVGEHIPIEDRPSAFSYIMMGMSFSSAFIAGPVINYLSGFRGWRTAYLGYVLPVSLAGLILAMIGIPSASKNPQPSAENQSYLEAFKNVLSNKSAVSCVACTALALVTFQGIIAYGISFYVERFQIPLDWRTLIWAGMAFSVTIGSFLGGKIVKRFGRKPISIVGVLLVGLSTVLYTNIPNLWTSITISWFCCFIAGVRSPAATSLTLEQVPRFRGTTMSLNSAASSLGSAFGSGIGGAILLGYGYGVLGIVLGGMGIAASFIYHFFTIDPTLAQP